MGVDWVDWPDSLKGNMTGRNWETFSSKKGPCVKNWQWSADVGGGSGWGDGGGGGQRRLLAEDSVTSRRNGVREKIGLVWKRRVFFFSPSLSCFVVDLSLLYFIERVSGASKVKSLLFIYQIGWFSYLFTF